MQIVISIALHYVRLYSQVWKTLVIENEQILTSPESMGVYHFWDAPISPDVVSFDGAMY